MQLRKSEPIGVFDDDHCRVWDIDTNLDHRCCNQHIYGSITKPLHRLLTFLCFHPTMHDFNRFTLEKSIAQTLRMCSNRFQSGLGFIHKGNNDITLLPLVNEFNHVGIGLCSIIRLDEFCCNGGSTRWQGVDC